MSIVISNLSKAFQGKPVLQDFSLTLYNGSRICLMAPSGAGKTTLLRILMGLEKPDSGTIAGLKGIPIGVVFQEDRLCEALGPVRNVALACRRPQTEIEQALTELLPEHCLYQPVRELSGGMRRRVALCRAMLSPGQVLLLDEPFTGLDDANRAVACRFVLAHLAGRTLLVVTHQREDAAHLDATLVTFQKEA